MEGGEATEKEPGSLKTVEQSHGTSSDFFF